MYIRWPSWRQACWTSLISFCNINESMNQRINESINQWINEPMNQWINKSMNQWIKIYTLSRARHKTAHPSFPLVWPLPACGLYMLAQGLVLQFFFESLSVWPRRVRMARMVYERAVKMPAFLFFRWHILLKMLVRFSCALRWPRGWFVGAPGTWNIPKPL